MGNAIHAHKFKPSRANAGPNPREIEVFRLLSYGLTNKEVAHVMGIKEPTVESHRYNLSKKIKARTATGIYRELVIAGYIDPFAPAPENITTLESRS